MKTFIFLFLFVISFNGYSQMMFSAPFNYDINRFCEFQACDPIGKTSFKVHWYDVNKFDNISYRIYTKGDTTIFNYSLIEVDSICGCHIHKIYYFVNDTCIKYICNYLLSQGTYYTVDKQEVILAPPDFLAKEESDTKYSFQLLLPGITSKVNLCNSFLFLPEIITSSGLSK